MGGVTSSGFVPGVLYSADLTAAVDWGRPVYALKTADQARNSSTTLTDDTELTVPVVASAKYALDLFLYYDATAGVDIKFGFTFPAGATLTFGGICYLVGGSFTIAMLRAQRATSGSTTLAASGGTTPHTRIDGTLITGATAGDLTLQWAQNTSNAAATTVKTDSLLRLTRFA